MNDDDILEHMLDLTQSYQQNVRSIMGIYDQLLQNIETLTRQRRIRRNLFPIDGVNIWSSRRTQPPPESLYDSPNREQINIALEHIQYNSDITQDCDPIDLLQFTTNEDIVRIRHCGHCFREINLNTWFRSSVFCPLCRVDIRDPIY